MIAPCVLGLALAAALGSAVAGNAAAAESELLEVAYRDGSLSVHAERVPLGRVLREIARRARIALSGESGATRDVSVDFDRVPLVDGVRRLLGFTDHLLVIDCSPDGNIDRLDIVLFGNADPPLGGVPNPAVSGGDAAARRSAVARLGAHGDERALPGILRALGDASPEVRETAIASLAQYGEMALEPLQRVVRGEADAGVRLAAVQVLGLVGGAGADSATLLSEMLQDSDARIRAAAAAALTRADHPGATDALQVAAGDRDPEVRIAALQALAARAGGPGANAVLIRHLDDEDPAVRSVAATLLPTVAR